MRECGDGGDGLVDAYAAAEVARQVSDDRRERTDEGERDEEADGGTKHFVVRDLSRKKFVAAFGTLVGSMKIL